MFRKSDDLYVASFSEDPESLDQWDRYAAKGAGVAIGFTRSGAGRLEAGSSFLRELIGEFQVIKVAYDESVFREYVTSEIKATAVRLEEEDLASNHLGYAAGWIWSRAARYKHPSFKNEQEWRVVTSKAIRAENISIRTQGKYLVPYVPLDFVDEDTIVTVILSREASKEPFARRGLEMTLKAHELGGVSIQESQIPRPVDWRAAARTPPPSAAAETTSAPTPPAPGSRHPALFSP